MFGNILLTLALAASLFSIIMYYFTFRGYKNTISYARISYHVMGPIFYQIGDQVSSAPLEKKCVLNQHPCAKIITTK